MCEPKYYGIEYEINPHMNLKNQAKSDLAHRQYSNLCDILTRAFKNKVDEWVELEEFQTKCLMFSEKG